MAARFHDRFREAAEKRRDRGGAWNDFSAGGIAGSREQGSASKPGGGCDVGRQAVRTGRATFAEPVRQGIREARTEQVEPGFGGPRTGCRVVTVAGHAGDQRHLPAARRRWDPRWQALRAPCGVRHLDAAGHGLHVSQCGSGVADQACFCAIAHADVGYIGLFGVAVAQEVLESMTETLLTLVMAQSPARGRRLVI